MFQNKDYDVRIGKTKLKQSYINSNMKLSDFKDVVKSGKCKCGIPLDLGEDECRYCKNLNGCD